MQGVIAPSLLINKALFEAKGHLTSGVNGFGGFDMLSPSSLSTASASASFA